jgi:hypothetical protein
VTYTLKVLAPAASGAAEGGLRTVLFRRIGDGAAIEIRAETDAPNLLARLPDFLEAALEVQRSIWPRSRVGYELSMGMLSRLAEELSGLRALADEDDEAHLRRALEQKQRIREATIVRNIAAEALVSALGPGRKPEIDALAKSQRAPAALAESLERLAAYLDQALKDPKEAGLLIACDLDAAYAASLLRHADALSAFENTKEGAPKRRGLLRLIGTAYRVLRAEAQMAAPGIEPLSWMLDVSAGAPAPRRSKRGRRRGRLGAEAFQAIKDRA